MECPINYQCERNLIDFWRSIAVEINYRVELAKKLGAPLSQRMMRIFEEMFTPRECKLLLELFAPATCQELAGRLQVNEKELLQQLEDLVARGVLTRGKTQYAFHTTLLALHHDVVGDPAVEPVSEKLKELWADFFYNEWCDKFVEGYIKRQADTGYPVHRVWPAIGALELSPNIKPEDILPEEDFRLTIKNAKRRIIANCGCRNLWGKCNHPVDTCFACFDNDRGEYYLNKPSRTLKDLTLEETMALISRNEKLGLVHIGVCFCCSDACEILYSLKRTHRFDLLAASRYLVQIDEEKCTGCQACVMKCQFDAIQMRQPEGAKKGKATVIEERCKGCGVCIVGCKQRAMTYKLVRPPDYITNAPRRMASGINPWGFYNLK
jgi:Na+-translocating ferredoxin:NAD+ oxidoreductase subunit B